MGNKILVEFDKKRIEREYKEIIELRNKMKKKDRLQELMEEYGEICKKAIPVLFKFWFEMDKFLDKKQNKAEHLTNK